ncbi:hypothetical protein NLJ89_g2663 [Agrocybe chaxingu]|uniref:Uncharacterized protein n=1 Tax=Agrocybe chaxingu TaxID=84603 RepID=A0A9W8K652_9AGAR|nr:hypothetical protein NLJ89_g2663 [Agrocybe chaxingu]
MPPPPDPTHAHGHIHRSSHSHSHSHAHPNAHAHAHTHPANHGTPRPHAHGHSHKRATPEEDEERFTFGKDFVAATAALFEAEVLPAYPNFPGMRSGLYEAPLPDTLPASEAGELYASRKKVAEMQGQMPSQAQMNGAQMLQQQQIQQQRQQHLQSQQTAATAYELGHPHLPHPNAYSQNHQAAQAPPMMAMSMSAPMSIAQQHPQPYAPGYSSPPAHPASMNGMNARAASYASYPPQSSSYPPNYGSSLTGWAG